jgi:hypothetical protein
MSDECVVERKAAAATLLLGHEFLLGCTEEGLDKIRTRLLDLTTAIAF